METLDIILLLPLVWGAYRGFRNGFTIELFTLAALILGIWGAIHFSDWVAEYLVQNIDIERKYLPMTSFAITFLGIVIAINLLAKLLTTLLKAVALNGINRLVGLAFGVLKWSFLLSVLLFLWRPVQEGSWNWPSRADREASLLYEPMANLAPTFFPYLEELDWRSWWEREFDKVKDDVDDVLDEL